MVAQVALSLVLVTSALLFSRSLVIDDLKPASGQKAF